jgi:hypothetical protein
VAGLTVAEAAEIGEDTMSEDHHHINPKDPHGFEEHPNPPFSIPVSSMGPGSGQNAGPEIAFRRTEPSDFCAVCGKPREDRIHAASENAADNEHWPV